LRLWIYPLITALVVALVGMWAIGTVRREIQKNLKKELSTILSANVNALEIWIEAHKNTISVITTGTNLRRIVMELVSLEDGNRLSANRNSRLIRKNLQMDLNDQLSEKIKRANYSGFVVIDPKGRVIAAGSDDLIGMHIPGMPEFHKRRSPRRGPRLAKKPLRIGRLVHVFETGEPEVVAPFKVTFSELPREFAQSQPRDSSSIIMMVGSPILSDEGEIIAVLGLRIRPREDFTRILSVARSGQSGESYAFNTEGMIISESRFDQQLMDLNILENSSENTCVLNLQLRDPGGDLTQGFVNSDPRSSYPLTYPVKLALGEKSSDGINIDGFRDYRGVNVVGAWKWLPEYDFGVVSKMDAVVAYRPLVVLRRTFVVLIGMLSFSSIGMLVSSLGAVRLQRRVQKAEMEIRQLGQYTLRKKIGEDGGMGAVFLADHVLMKRPTAVKLLPPEKAGRSAVARFEREVQFTSRLSHPNTIQIFDYGHTPEGVFYYAMEYLEGINLKKLIRDFGPQPDGRVIHILDQICASLTEAHRRDLIHRDIKPANVILCERGGIYDTVKVLDFGLVKSIGSPEESSEIMVTQEQSITGTPLYMSPESIEEPSTVDGRSDLYSLGALAYFLVSGENVFQGRSIMDICRRHIDTPAVSLSERTDKPVDQRLEQLIMQCLEKDPQARPATADALQSELRKCAAFGAWNDSDIRDWWNQKLRQDASRPEKSDQDTASQIAETIQINYKERQIG